MKAYVQTAIGRFEEQDLPPPSAAPGEVVLRMRAALTCGTDVKILRRGHTKVSLPVTMGHEICGEVVELGEGVSGWKIGERAAPGVSGPCGRCADCTAGRANLCSGSPAWMWGTFAERVRIPAGIVAVNLHRVPEGVSDEVAAFLDPLASVIHGWNRLGTPAPGPGSSMLIYGAGALAFLWAGLASKRGVEVVLAGRRTPQAGGTQRPPNPPERAKLAERFGARFLDVTGGFPEGSPRPADIAVDCTGDRAVWERLPALVRAGGRVLLFGGCAPGATVTFDAARLHYSEISLIGSFHYTPEEARASLEALASGAIDPRPLIAESGTLSDLPRFLEAQQRGEGLRYALRG
ncbi:MAG TPA: alcohol dehydrogenase catalytic domain-containing protein [Thermoanaerobaculia bacterium]|jgi:L-iditol 2-dehydrogenase